ncbi:unnamed protein product [Prorocentrum cordatum]|uniref:Uncharacterized protein n=1 Tax=Prorocentrum cordatum TaxID=2364126 RepID=A0ABN9Y512_9DINO|nr:unnamed protein product [Polarella glacialis]
MWKSGWSEDKKKFCCQSESVGCDESPTDIDVDCDAGYDQWEAGWSEEKKKACCNLENKGCNFDCAAGQDMWKTGWSEDKKKFCCQSGSVGCDESLTDIDVDCDAGYDLWEAGWSEQKKKLCCDTVGKGCTFDCEAGYSMWAAGWSDGKKQYCCKTEHKGCKEPRGDGSGAMVMTLSLVFGILFCCIALLIACLGFGLFNYLRDKFNSLSQRTTVDPKQGQHKAVSEWIFKPSDGNAIVTLEGPSVDSPDTGNRLEPREVFQVSEERAPEVEDKFEDVEGGMTMEEVDDVNRHFLKLADGRGWVLDREAGHEMCYRLGEPVDERWIYDPENGKPMGIREEPALDGEQTGEVIRPGDRFEVSEILLADGEVLALRLMDDRGWVFDEISDGSIVCRRLLDETWVYEPENGAPIGIRSGPDVYGEKTGHKLHAEETFQVEEIEVGDDGTLFLKLEDGRGWLFDKHPELGNMCRRVT